jgi:hypothetical protein
MAERYGAETSPGLARAAGLLTLRPRRRCINDVTNDGIGTRR